MENNLKGARKNTVLLLVAKKKAIEHLLYDV